MIVRETNRETRTTCWCIVWLNIVSVGNHPELKLDSIGSNHNYTAYCFHISLFVQHQVMSQPAC